MQNSEVCSNCNNNISYRPFGRFGRLKFYKYCPKCGIDINSHIETKVYGFFRKWLLELMYLLWFISSLNRHPFTYLVNFISFSIMSVFYYFLFIQKIKKCSHCFTVNPKTNHVFCHNCGTEYTKNVLQSFIDGLQSAYHRIFK